MKSATFKPLRFDGDIDTALSHLGHCLLGTFGTTPNKILAAVSKFSPTNQLMLTRQKDTGEHLQSEVVYAITPLRRMNWGPHLDLAWLAFTWVPEEEVTRVTIRPMSAARDAMRLLWAWLEKTLNEQGVLVGAEPHEEKDEPKPWKAANVGAHQKLAKAWWAHKGNFQAIAEALNLSEDYVSTEIPKIRKYAIEAVPYKKDLPPD